jgi:hypothetical protein
VVDFNFVWIHLPHAVCAAVILQRFRRTRAAGSLVAIVCVSRHTVMFYKLRKHP